MRHPRRTYRPSRDDFIPKAPQQLSCKAAGQFDKKFHTSYTDGKISGRHVTTAWTAVCFQREITGVSRSARIAGRAQ